MQIDLKWVEFIQWEFSARQSIDLKIIYIDMTEDILAGLLLSQIIFWHLPDRDGNFTKLRVIKDGKFWLVKSHSDWWNEIRMSEDQIRRAMKILNEKGLVETATFKFAGVPKTHIRIQTDNFIQLWNEIRHKEVETLMNSGLGIKPKSTRYKTQVHLGNNPSPLTKITSIENLHRSKIPSYNSPQGEIIDFGENDQDEFEEKESCLNTQKEGNKDQGIKNTSSPSSEVPPSPNDLNQPLNMPIFNLNENNEQSHNKKSKRDKSDLKANPEHVVISGTEYEIPSDRKLRIGRVMWYFPAKFVQEFCDFVQAYPEGTISGNASIKSICSAWNTLVKKKELDAETIKQIMEDLPNRKSNHSKWLSGYVEHATKYLKERLFETQIIGRDNKPFERKKTKREELDENYNYLKERLAQEQAKNGNKTEGDDDQW